MFLLLLLTYILHEELTDVTVMIRNLHKVKHLLSGPQPRSKSVPVNHPDLREHKVTMVLNRPLKCSQKVPPAVTQ